MKHNTLYGIGCLFVKSNEVPNWFTGLLFSVVFDTDELYKSLVWLHKMSFRHFRIYAMWITRKMGYYTGVLRPELSLDHYKPTSTRAYLRQEWFYLTGFFVTTFFQNHICIQIISKLFKDSCQRMYLSKISIICIVSYKF